MEEFLIYLLKSGICLGVFLLIYQLFLRKTTFFRFNRAFLLFGMIASLIIPAIQFTYDVPVSISVSDIPVAINEGNVELSVVENSTINIWTVLLAIYFIGITILSFRNILLYRNLSKILKSGTKVKNGKYKLVDSIEVKSPFSVLNYILLNTRNLSETEKNLILEHEITHISQKHWFDLLCSECMLLLQWFNPFVWIYVMLQKENHEFLADKAVIDKGTSPALYQAVLINQQFKGPVFSFSNSFNYSNHLNRLNMIKKRKSSPWKRAAALTIIPVFGLFFWASATPNYIIDNFSENDRIQESLKTEIRVQEFKVEDTVKGKEVVLTSNGRGINKDTVVVVGYGTKKDNGIQIRGLEKTPLFVIDGKKVSEEEMKKISSDDIDNVSVLKGKSATAIYSEDGENGVVVIETKEYKKNKRQVSADLSNINASIVIDGKESTRKELDNLSTSDIYSFSILKDKAATEAYGEKGKNGVILVTTMEANGKATAATSSLRYSNHDAGTTSIDIVSRNVDVEKLLLIVDGKEQPAKNLQSMAPDIIESISVYKDKDAIEKYGEKGKNGVIIVQSKQKKQGTPPPPPPLSKRYTVTDKSLIIIDGKESTFKEYSKVAKNRKSMKVMTGDEAVKEYGAKGKDGVVIIETKNAQPSEDVIHITVEDIND